ncbi:MAG: A/G-specific adenine glycosylase, partial [Chitinophagaceae bacterium]
MLPWKGENAPYKIWLSEIILQQTRAEQGIPYYLRFVEHYPTIIELAHAPDDEVFRLWQGLGYYARCRNMLFTARKIANDFGGKFPDNYQEIRELKGVGNYTAAAIASFAFGLPYAVLDGNVYRVLSRYFGIETAIDSTEGKAIFQPLADDVLDKKNPAAFNQAIMDLGAIICLPKHPECSACPVSSACIAKENDLIKLLPVKSKKVKVQERYFNFLLLQFEDKFWLHRREEKGIWKGL